MLGELKLLVFLNFGIGVVCFVLFNVGFLLSLFLLFKLIIIFVVNVLFFSKKKKKENRYINFFWDVWIK